jgi:hypothetical protein
MEITKSAIKRSLGFLLLVVLASCVDPYVPDLRSYKSLLVIEGIITDAEGPYTIKLHRTTNQMSATPQAVNDAVVSITDNGGKTGHFVNTGNGTYQSLNDTFRGEPGKKYTLHIKTGDGEEYASEECMMYPVAGIESIYYSKGEEISGAERNNYKGIKILLNSADAAGLNKYFRWEFEETWKFITPSPQRFKYIDSDNIYPITVENDVCYKRNYSGQILTAEMLPGEGTAITAKEIQFVAPERSDRLTFLYSILVRQYSVSEKEYSFWNNLKKISEAGGDIFNSQPFPIIGNIHNVNDKSEMVLGYFEVSAMAQKRIFITAGELDALELPHYAYDCTLIYKAPSDYYTSPWQALPTFDEIYLMFTGTGNYDFVEPVYNSNTGALLMLVFVRKECAECSLTGTRVRPDFWVDL